MFKDNTLFQCFIVSFEQVNAGWVEHWSGVAYFYCGTIMNHHESQDKHFLISQYTSFNKCRTNQQKTADLFTFFKQLLNKKKNFSCGVAINICTHDMYEVVERSLESCTILDEFCHVSLETEYSTTSSIQLQKTDVSCTKLQLKYHRRIQNSVKNLRWSVLGKQSTAISRQILQNSPSWMFDIVLTPLNTEM